MATRLSITVMIEITIATIGRLTKKRAMIFRSAASRGRFGVGNADVATGSGAVWRRPSCRRESAAALRRRLCRLASDSSTTQSESTRWPTPTLRNPTCSKSPPPRRYAGSAALQRRAAAPRARLGLEQVLARPHCGAEQQIGVGEFELDAWVPVVIDRALNRAEAAFVDGLTVVGEREPDVHPQAASPPPSAARFRTRR
jgi:hypothetical protein